MQNNTRFKKILKDVENLMIKENVEIMIKSCIISLTSMLKGLQVWIKGGWLIMEAWVNGKKEEIGIV